MVLCVDGQVLLFNVLWLWDLLIVVLFVVGFLFGGGLLMWWFECYVQFYFQGIVCEVVFFVFWWVLNFVVNGGFEECMLCIIVGCIFGIILVFVFLFLVLIFVVKIIVVMIVDVICLNVEGVSDFYGKWVVIIENLIVDLFLINNGFVFICYVSFDEMIMLFEQG